MKVWLDDVREAPEGWIHIRTPEEAIDLLRSGAVEEISLDHDLGIFTEEGEATGYDVLLWDRGGGGCAALEPSCDARPFGQSRCSPEDGSGHRLDQAARGGRGGRRMNDERHNSGLSLADHLHPLSAAIRHPLADPAMGGWLRLELRLRAPLYRLQNGHFSDFTQNALR